MAGACSSRTCVHGIGTLFLLLSAPSGGAIPQGLQYATSLDPVAGGHRWCAASPGARPDWQPYLIRANQTSELSA
jgi:hypothetical protein